MDWIISIVLFIIALGTLICLHELGHFLTAKIFNVYCHEFSIGFGPAILHKRKEGKETYFSIRAIPLGGYVAMFGEEDEEIEPGLNLPPERSIEGIKKWKKAIVVSAGVVVNAILAIIIFSISNLCFPTVNTVNSIKVNDTSLVANFQDGDQLDFISYIDPNVERKEATNNFISENRICVIDDDIVIEGRDDIHYVLVFRVYSQKEDNNFSKGLALYLADKNTNMEAYKDWTKLDGSTGFYLPIVKQTGGNDGKFVSDAEFDAQINIVRGEENLVFNQHLVVKKGVFEDIGFAFGLDKTFAPFKERFGNIWKDFGESAIAVGKGIVTLFKPHGIEQMSGLVGIFVVSKNIYSTRTFSYYLYMWGLISVNLAIFNLLPFPGLDGWQLLVTVIESISKKKISSKFKAIMNLIGFALLIVLMVAVLVVDIRRFII